MSNIVKVNFHGDTLDCVQDGGTVLVSIRRVCEWLGVDHARQIEKLKNKPWAVVDLKSMTGPDGKNYATSCISLDSLPMWLATIEPSRVRPNMSAKLEVYQRECAKVLRDHFFGAPKEFDPSAIIQAVQLGVTTAIQTALSSVQSLQEQILDLKEKVENRPLSDNCIGNRGARLVLSAFRSYALAMGGDDKKAVRSYRGLIEVTVRSALHFNGAGANWAAFPCSRWSDLKTKLDEVQRMASIQDRRQMILALLPKEN